MDVWREEGARQKGELNAKALGQKSTWVFEQQIGGQCGWGEARHGEKTS